MATIDFPDVVPSRLDWKLQANTSTFKSPLSGSTQTMEFPGARWVAKATFNNMNRNTAYELEAFFATVRGASGRFYFYNHARGTSRGNPLGTITVDGPSQTGNTMDITGITTTNGQYVFRKGDFIEFNDELKMVTADLLSDGSGDGTVTFEPPIRTAPSDGAGITYTDAKAIMKLTDDKQGSGTYTPGVIASFTFSCEEAF